MVRTQIQLSEEQAAMLRNLATRLHVSVAEVIRQAVDSILRSPSRVTTAERRARAIAAAGRFRSGLKDLSKGHDRYLAEAFRR